MEDVKETEIGLLAKKNVNNPVVTFLYIENDSNNIFNIRSISRIKGVIDSYVYYKHNFL